MRKKRTLINVFSSLMVFAVNILINFWLSPYIVRNIGVEANGFVTLASNFITYAQLIVLALNGMAARFITIEYNKKNYETANLYYNSVFWGNLFIVILFLIPVTFFILKLDSIINIPSSLILDVKILFSIVFLNFFIQTGLPNWDCGTFVSNRMDRMYIPQVVATITKCIILVCLFLLFTPKVYFVGIAALVYLIIMMFCNAYNTKKLTPKLYISLDLKNIIFSWKATFELIGAGIWSTISNVGVILLSGLDLIICNILLGATHMGILSLTKVISNCFEQLSSQVRSALMPELTINYALENNDELLQNIHNSMNLTSFILIIPLTIFLVFGDVFYSIWIPSQDSKVLWILSILSILSLLLTTGTQILYNVFDITNKVKYNAIAMIVSGLFSILLTVIALLTTNLGIYAVAGISSISNILRNMFFTLPVTAKLLGFKWYEFYCQVFKTVKCIIVISVLGFVIKYFIHPVGLVNFIFVVFLMIILGFIVNYNILFHKEEKNKVASLIKRKLKICH